MKKILLLIVSLSLISCGGLGSIFNSGSVRANDYQEIIVFNYDNNLALVDIIINNKKYQFLVDTGAPTVISEEIYEDLNIKPVSTTMVSDSQGQKRNQDVVIIPEIRLGNLTYKKIGAVVANMRDVFEFNCMGIDGILGANQMAKSYWKFDYQNKEITITDRLQNFDLLAYNDVLDFTTSAQKTPYVNGTINGQSALFTYDTGFAGNIDLDKDVDSLKYAKGFHSYGSSSIGLYGAKDSVTTRTVKLEGLKLGSMSLEPQIVELEDGGLLGNLFMNKHDVIIDWKSNKIYLKKVKVFETAEVKSFGLGLRFKNNQVVVSSLIKELPIELQLGDQILSINDMDFTNLNNEQACDSFLNLELKDLDTINLTYLREGIFREVQLNRILIIK
jgi:predicted aspartyl protease